MPTRPKILIVRMKAEEDESFVVFELGMTELTRKIPSGHGLVRASAILNDNGELVDVEIITAKT